MTGNLAIITLAFRACLRSHPIRALAFLLLLSSILAPSLVAFTFTGDDALAVAGALGSATLLAPLAALFGGVAFAAGDRGGDGFAPLLRGPFSAGAAAIAAAAGISAAAIAFSGICVVAAAISLSISGRNFDAINFVAAAVSAFATAPAAAAAGILLAVAAPRALASALAAIGAAAVLAGPGLVGGGGGVPAPTASAFLLARDAAFGELPADAVALSCAAALAAAGALAASTVVLCRAKDLAPCPGDA